MNQKRLQKIADELEFDLEDVAMILEAFLKDSVVNLEVMNSAIDTNDYEAIRMRAHGIKGSASNILLNDIVEVAFHLETNASQKNEIDYKQEYFKLQNLIEGLKDEKSI